MITKIIIGIERKKQTIKIIENWSIINELSGNSMETKQYLLDAKLTNNLNFKFIHCFTLNIFPSTRFTLLHESKNVLHEVKSKRTSGID